MIGCGAVSRQQGHILRQRSRRLNGWQELALMYTGRACSLKDPSSSCELFIPLCMLTRCIPGWGPSEWCFSGEREE